MNNINYRKVIYFPQPGAQNTEAVFHAVAERLQSGDIAKVLVATTSGATGVLAVNKIKNAEIIVITHSYGFRAANKQELLSENRRLISSGGGKILTCTHAFGGVGRAVRKKFASVQIDELIAQTLRMFGDGAKVGVEMCLMAADAGLVDYAENVITIAGSDSGADTALVIKAANAQTLFDLRVQEIICKPLFPE